MCGIYGIVRFHATLGESDLSWAEAARRLLQHRGPDGHQRQFLLEGRCLLGHNRLAIIDLEGGTQPLCNEDRTVWVICNGEIYNYVELRERLLEKGHRFATQSDCEVLVHLYEERGAEMLDELEGMFAFALVDTRTSKLMLARDRFGEKPLYWAELPGGGLAFASEMKALQALPELSREPDYAALAQFLFLRYIPAPSTHWQSIRKLRAGERLVADGSLDCRLYWETRFVPEATAARSADELQRELWDRLVESVRLRLRSDVPVGAFLSGGIDSTAVVCVARQLQPANKLHTFCATFEGTILDEGPYARRVAEHLATEHEEVTFSTTELLPLVDELIAHYDEPFADASMLPTFAVCRAARRACKVMLSGDGGDEFLGGYREFFRYSEWNGVRRFPGMNAIARTMQGVWKKSARGIGLLQFLGQGDRDLLFSERECAAVLRTFREEYRGAALAGLEELRQVAIQHGRLPYPSSRMEATANAYLPEQILVKVDRASMRSALECRAPFLDSQLVQFLLRLPPDVHFSEGHGKALLRRALPDWVPEEIRWRNKQGFTPPFAEWLRTSLREKMQDALNDCDDRLGKVLDTSAIRQKFAAHVAGAEHGDELFRWLVLSRTV